MIGSDNLLFIQQSLHNVLQGQSARGEDCVQSISNEQFISNTNEQITAYVFSKLEILPLTIYRDRAVRSVPREITVQHIGVLNQIIFVDGVEIELLIPYSGESDLWKYQPSTFDFNPPRGIAIADRSNDQIGILKIKLGYTHDEFKSDAVNKEIEGVFKSLDSYLYNVKREIEIHNDQLKNEISRLVCQRRERLGAIQKTSETLILPIEIKEGTPSITELPIEQKVILPLPSKKPSTPEYGISDSIYDSILLVLRHEGISFERTPTTYAVHDEEELRDILLAHLNSYFKGQATGETFRKNGKTDICIEFENRAAFVAECKLWRGNQAVIEAINQLLGYLTWRDVKAALIIFNKDVAGFKQIQDKVLNILREHPNCVRAEFLPGTSEWRMILRSREDAERLITLRVLLFNLYTT
jgi:hypothetical protein